MMRYHLSSFLIFLSLTFVYGQSNNHVCNCPETEHAGTKADTAFHFSNGKIIVLCGYKDPDRESDIFSEFILAVCEEDTIIDFWGAVLTCRLKVDKDTLNVEQLENLPIGVNFAYEETVWTTEKLYFQGQSMKRERVLNRQIRNYDPIEIASVLKAYEIAKSDLDDGKMELANRLFIAAISGSEKALQYFEEFKNKFDTLDGAYAEEYKDLTAMLELWETKDQK